MLVIKLSNVPSQRTFAISKLVLEKGVKYVQS